MTIVFKIVSQKYPNKTFSVPNLGNFAFSRNFAIMQIWWGSLHIWQNFFKSLAQKYPNKAFLVPNLDIFVFLENFAIRQIWGCWLKIWQ